MQLISTLFMAMSAIGALAGPSGTPATYYLQTQLKPNQTGKGHFNNLYLTAYHSGAGFNDAVLLPTKQNAVIGYLVKTNVTPADGHDWYDQRLNYTNSQYPADLFILEGINTYAGWQPIQINTVELNNPQSIGFWINSDGLQMSTSPKYPNSTNFEGWLACQWWRGVPQLFWQLKLPVPLPKSCAQVNLVPRYFS